MPTFVRIAADNKVEANVLTRPTTIQTPFGQVTGQAGNWLIQDYLGSHQLFDYDSFKAKFDPFDQEAIDYLAAWKPVARIDAIEPTSGAAGSTVYLSGAYFLATQGAAKVYFGIVHAIEATVTVWADTAITVTVPAGLPTTYDISVWIARGTKISNRVGFRATI